MTDNNYHEIAREVIEENDYLALSTTDGTEPWVAAIEFLRDEAGDFYVFSTTESRHAQHIETNGTVAAAIWGSDQPEYASDLTTDLDGVQIHGEARRVPEEEYPEAVVAGIEAFDLPMPPYAVFALTPQRVYVPILEDGINKRVEVDIG